MVLCLKTKGPGSHHHPYLFDYENTYPATADYASLRDDIINKNLRPIIPAHIFEASLPANIRLPSDFATLITECWRKDPSTRPPFTAIVGRLAKLLGIQPAEAGSLQPNKDELWAPFLKVGEIKVTITLLITCISLASKDMMQHT